MATTTAAQQREARKNEYNAFLALCPSRKLLDRISDKWVTLVLGALGGCEVESRAMRYGEISRQVAGISQKMLTQTLRTLERDGLVTRTVTPTVPVTVSYELTALGTSLYEMVRSVKSWAELHMDEVLAHRESYEAAAQS